MCMSLYLKAKSWSRQEVLLDEKYDVNNFERALTVIVREEI